MRSQLKSVQNDTDQSTLRDEKQKRINNESRRLKKIFKDAAPKQRQASEGLINRAAWMRISLEDFEDDLDANGYTELFSQSEKTEPYERERPAARLYNTMVKNYQTTIKQLLDLIPAEVRPKKEEESKLLNIIGRTGVAGG